MPRPPLLASAFALTLTALPLSAARAASVAPAFTKTTLANGLTVLVHEDHTLPVAAVDIYYRVGSRDERAKHTGFAHLFEHLMFMGTPRVPLKMFDAWMAAAGGSNNAWTSQDATDYHETAPPGALPLLLWLEADRLATLGREIDTPKLDLQRDVVRNERRQSIENVPYGMAELRLPELLYPDAHPYHHPVIGSHQDLEAASVDDVRGFFGTYYAPSNASLCVAGDVRASDVVALATKYFGGIAPGTRPERAPLEQPAPKLGSIVRETIEDRVELAKIVMAFHSPALFAPGDAELDLLADVLATGKASRLYKALVYDRPLAQAVSATQNSQDLSSYFSIELLARPGVSLDELEKAADRVLADVAAKPPTAAELERSKAGHEFHFVNRLQSVAERATMLNTYEVKKGDPGFFDKDLERYRTATAEGVHRAAKATLSLAERVILRIVPMAPPDAKAPASAAKRGAR